MIFSIKHTLKFAFTLIYVTRHVKNNNFWNLWGWIWSISCEKLDFKKEKHIGITYHFTLEVFLESYYLIEFNIQAIIIMQASLIANCVFNALLPFTAITLNHVTILALRKPLTIPRALKVLLLSLAVSDLSASLLVQSLYITSLMSCW